MPLTDPYQRTTKTQSNDAKLHQKLGTTVSQNPTCNKQEHIIPTHKLLKKEIMKFTTALFVVMAYNSIMGTSAASNLRPKSPPPVPTKGNTVQVSSIEGTVRDAQTTKDAKKKDAKREKYQTLKSSNGSSTTTPPAHQIHHKEPGDATQLNATTTNNNNFEINIVGGTGAGANEFPYFGKLS